MKTKPDKAILKVIADHIKKNLYYFDLEQIVFDNLYDDCEYLELAKLNRKEFNAMIKGCITKPKYPKDFSNMFDEIQREAKRLMENQKRRDIRQQQWAFAKAEKDQAIQDVLNNKAKFLASLTKEQKALYKETQIECEYTKDTKQNDKRLV
jgi:hypothetical protein